MRLSIIDEGHKHSNYCPRKRINNLNNGAFVRECNAYLIPGKICLYFCAHATSLIVPLSLSLSLDRFSSLLSRNMSYY